MNFALVHKVVLCVKEKKKVCCEKQILMMFHCGFQGKKLWEGLSLPEVLHTVLNFVTEGRYRSDFVLACVISLLRPIMTIMQ